MADNVSTAVDQDGEFDDWLELYTNSTETLNLDGLYLSEDSSDLLAWEFPDGLTLTPDSYLIIWCDKDLDQDGLHADIKFSASGESAILSYADGTIIEDITFGEQEEDIGYGRVPNGTGDFVIKNPTFGIDNETILAVNDVTTALNITLYPNPTKDMLNIRSAFAEINSVRVSSVLGRLLFNNIYDASTQLELDFSGYEKGIYFVTINNETTYRVIKK